MASFLQKISLTLIVVFIIGPFWAWPLTAAIIYCGHKVVAALMIGWSIWKLFVAYFPIKMIKTCDLDPKKNYIFCAHPHGVDVHLLVLAAHFRAPFVRELALLHGLRSSSRAACLNILNGGPGQSIVLIPGGAGEAFLPGPGKLDVLLSRQKGFVRLALRTGACLVPVLSFGEAELYDREFPPPGSFLDRLQKVLFKATGFGFPLFYGVGLFTKEGKLPKSVPINSVIGKPIEVPKFNGSIDGPEFRELTNEWHAKYITALKQLYDANKDKYANERRKSLTIL